MSETNGHVSNGKLAGEPAKGKSARQPTNRQKAAQRDYTPDYEEPTRRPAGDRPNAFNALAWLVEGATGLFEELQHNDLGLSEDFWTHAHAAQRESLLALRAALDSLIEKSVQTQKAQEERIKRRERRGGINVE